MSSTADRTRKVVEGALRSAVNDHGPITSDLIPSAVKRVVSQLRSAGAERSVLSMDGASKTAYEDVYKRLHNLRHGHERLIGTEVKLRAERDALLAALLKGWNWAQYDWARTHPEEVES